jgi:two-component system, chemotaxis family, protein-glutamate methylesterase/glutaminase
MSLSSSHPTVTVLIADDSPFMRTALSRMVESDESLSVIGTAQSGLEALAKIDALQPDVVTLDIDMPGMDGLETLKRVMAKAPRPVIIVSSLARRGAEATIEALELGAFDCIAKGLSYASEDVLKVQNELITKIKAAAGPHAFGRSMSASSASGPSVSDRSVPAFRISARLDALPQPVTSGTHRTAPAVIAIGASTGGPKALNELLSALPANLPVPILIVQHMPVGFTAPFAQRLDDICQLEVHEAKQGDLLQAGHVYVAAAGKHVTVRRRSVAEVVLNLSFLPSNVVHIPSADVMMCSVAEVFGSSAMGIILTGMGDDGTRGMKAIFSAGGLTLGQDQATCVVYGMPRSCAEIGVLSEVAPLPDIPGRIMAAVRQRKAH